MQHGLHAVLPERLREPRRVEDVGLDEGRAEQRIAVALGKVVVGDDIQAGRPQGPHRVAADVTRSTRCQQHLHALRPLRPRLGRCGARNARVAVG